MTLELDDVVLFETPDLLVIEYPTLDVEGGDIFDVRGTHELIDETVHFLGEELGTLVAVETTEHGDRVCLIEKPTDVEDGLDDFLEECRRESRWIRHDDPYDDFRLFDDHKSAEQIVDEIEDLLDEYDPSRRPDTTSGEWRDRLFGGGEPRAYCCGYCGGDHPVACCPKADKRLESPFDF